MTIRRVSILGWAVGTALFLVAAQPTLAQDWAEETTGILDEIHQALGELEEGAEAAETIADAVQDAIDYATSEEADEVEMLRRLGDVLDLVQELSPPWMNWFLGPYAEAVDSLAGALRDIDLTLYERAMRRTLEDLPDVEGESDEERDARAHEQVELILTPEQVEGGRLRWRLKRLRKSHPPSLDWWEHILPWNWFSSVVPARRSELADALVADGPTRVKTATFATDRGTVTVNLPGDLAAGDAIFTGVVVEPSGRDDDSGREDLGALAAYVLAVDGSGSPIRDGGSHLEIPRSAESESHLVLRSSAGAEIDRRPLTVRSPAPPLAVDFAHAISRFAAEGIAQNGRPALLRGPFDGDAATTVVEVDGRPAPILAESPRGVWFDVPADGEGASSLRVVEGERETTTRFHVLRLSLAASRTDLRRGESLRVTLAVGGLAGLPDEALPVPIEVLNLTPGVIRLDGSRDRVLLLSADRPADGTGTESFQFRVRATTTGTFSLVATVLGADSTRGRPAPDAAALRRLQAGDGIDRHRAKALAELFDWLHGPAAGR